MKGSELAVGDIVRRNGRDDMVSYQVMTVDAFWIRMRALGENRDVDFPAEHDVWEYHPAYRKLTSLATKVEDAPARCSVLFTKEQLELLIVALDEFDDDETVGLLDYVLKATNGF